MDLQQLINIVGKKGKRNATLLSSQNAKSDDIRVHQLYNGLKTAQFNDENQAAKKIFKSHTGDKNYIKLRSKLKEALLHNLFFLNYENDKHPEYAQVEYELRKTLLQKTAGYFTALRDASGLLNKTLSMAAQALVSPIPTL